MKTTKEFTIHIHGHADHNDDADNFRGVVTFDDLVNLYFRANKDKFEKVFEDIGGVRSKSYYDNFHFDAVSKDVEA